MLRLVREDVIIVGRDGGKVLVLDLESGEVVATLDCDAGTRPVGAFIRACGRGQALFAGDGVEVVKARSRVSRSRSAGHFESAANPTYRVTNAMRQARNLERQLVEMRILDKRMQARQEAMARSNLSPIPQPVISPPAAEQPAPSPAPSEVAEQTEA